MTDLDVYRTQCRAWLGAQAPPRTGDDRVRWGEGSDDVSVFHALSRGRARPHPPGPSVAAGEARGRLRGDRLARDRGRGGPHGDPRPGVPGGRVPRSTSLAATSSSGSRSASSHRPSSPSAPMSNADVLHVGSSRPRSWRASCSPSQVPVRISPPLPRGPYGTATSGSSPDRRCGHPARSSHPGVSSSPERIPTYPSTPVSPPSCSRSTRPASTYDPSGRCPADRRSTRSSSTRSDYPTHSAWATSVQGGRSRSRRSASSAARAGPRRSADHGTSCGPWRHGPAATATPRIRQELAAVYTHERLREITRLRADAARRAGGTPGPEGSIGKLLLGPGHDQDRGSGGRAAGAATSPRTRASGERTHGRSTSSARPDTGSPEDPTRSSGTSSPSDPSIYLPSRVWIAMCPGGRSRDDPMT